MKIYKLYSFKKILNITYFLIILVVLIVFSKQNFVSTKNSLLLFINNVFPSLFPFILFTEIILNTEVTSTLSKIFSKFTSKIFKVSKCSSTPIIIGSLCGFPMGAKATSSLYNDGLISKQELAILSSFTNNCNPIFIISTIGISMYNNIKIGIFLLFCHYLSSIIVGIIISNKHTNIIQYDNANLNSQDKKSKIKSTSFFEILTNSILNSFKTLILILGFIILFNLISTTFCTLLQNTKINSNLITIFTSIFEMTNGIKEISLLNISYKSKLILSSFLTSFSGFCIIFQIYSYFYKFEYKISKLIIYKLLNGIISMGIAYSLLSFTNILSFII